jgi:hypothetical protein
MILFRMLSVNLVVSFLAVQKPIVRQLGYAIGPRLGGQIGRVPKPLLLLALFVEWLVLRRGIA